MKDLDQVFPFILIHGVSQFEHLIEGSHMNIIREGSKFAKQFARVEKQIDGRGVLR